MKKLEKAPEWTLHLTLKTFEALNGVSELIEHINTEYLYWDKVKYEKRPADISAEELWSLVKLKRAGARNIKIGDYIFTYNLTDSIQEGLHLFDMNMGGNLASGSIIPEEDKDRYLVSSIMEEAIASSQIEGAVTTRQQAKDMLRKNIRPKTKSEQMIVNNYETIKRIVQIKDEPLTNERLLEIHRLIALDTLDDKQDEGRYRSNNDIKVVDAENNEVVHAPPDYTELPQLMEDLFRLFNENDPERFVHPIIKGCAIHFLIGYIHPFVDGNGRTARALFYWYLLRNGYWLTEYLSISRLIVKSKTRYARAFQYTETDDNDLTYFLQYKLKVMELAYKELKAYIERKIREKKRILHFQRIRGVNERQALIIKWLYDEPDLLFSVKEIETRFMVSNQTARTDLSGLVKMGYLQEMDLNKKTKGYYRHPDFDMLLGKML
ncbi:MAG: Fic family protein [Bacteroidia bacterium]|nr:Fic family protein [Bacteroidia bacterium]